MAYQNDIPKATDRLKDSQSDLLNNFASIYNLVNQDHVIFDAVGQGKHKQVSLPVQSPAPTFAAGEVGLYSFLDPTTSKNELYINKTNQVTVTQIPASASLLSISSTPVAGSNGWTYLPSGILIKWGITTVSIGSLQAINTTIATGPNYSAILGAQVSIFSGTNADVDRAVRLANFPGGQNITVWVSRRTSTASPGGTSPVSWLAIGY